MRNVEILQVIVLGLMGFGMIMFFGVLSFLPEVCY